ncbi:MAG TPA: adenylate/guanylate cyclase domain-containing protein [Candidatus Dormibacteraeota bacterium]|jgi:adenylate cyclase
MVRQSIADPRTAWRGAVAGLLAGILASAVFALGWLQGPYDALQDKLFPAPAPSGLVTLVAIDQSSEPLFGPYPWSNSYHAKVIDYLASLKPRAIIFDVVLDHLSGNDIPETPNVNSDQLLADSIRNAAAQFPFILVCNSDSQLRPIFVAAATAVGERELGSTDQASNVRGVPLHPGARCADDHTGQPAFVKALSAVGVPTSAVPIEKSEMLINFSRGSSPTCSYARIVNGGCPDPRVITGHIVVVGLKLLSAGDVYSQAVSFKRDASFCPLHHNPCLNENQNYGYRIVGDELSTVLLGRYLHTQPPLSVVLALLLTGPILGGLLYLLRFRIGFLVTGILVAGYVLGIWLLAAAAGMLADPIFLPAVVVLSAVGALMARYLLEERERRKVEGLFGQYVDPSVVNELVALASVEDLKLGGERRELTVLFADVRGFTTLSEELPPEEVMTLLNDFTERCTRIVFENGGTLDKYIGDAVMAFWNAPRPAPDHADRALAAAVAMAGTGAEELRKRGVRIGIGLCSGEVVVGNVGGAARKAYTAIGDVVNTASRLCSAAPGGSVLVADSTWDRLQERPPAEQLEPLSVKGRQGKVGVHAIQVDERVASAL